MEVEAGWSEVQGHHWLPSEFKASPGYLGLLSVKENKTKNGQKIFLKGKNPNMLNNRVSFSDSGWPGTNYVA